VRLQSPRIVLLVLALLGLGVVALTVLAGLGSNPPRATPAAPPAGTPAPVVTPRADLVTPTTAQQEAVPQQDEPTLRSQRVRCLSALDRSPVQGVQLYVEARPVAGPSLADGRLEVPGTVRSNRLEAWAPGWGPTRLPFGRPLPDEILLEPATAAVQVWVTSSDPGLRIVRTRLVQQGSFTREDEPWVPRLERQGVLSARAARLAPGSYHVYVWVAKDRDAPRALPRQEVELEAGRTISVQIDADAPREGERDG
jgi:hypothetical protein